MWELLLGGSIAVVLYSYVGYPAILYSIVTIVRRRRRRATRAADETDPPSVCVIISAFDEERVIRDKIENSLSQQYPADKLTVLVASDGSTDRTLEIAHGFQDRGVEVYHSRSRVGKSAVLNAVVKDRWEDVLVFTDANSLFSQQAVKNLVARLADPRIGCVVGRLRYVDRETSSAGKGERVYWRYEGAISRLESELSSVLVANGSIFAVRRELFEELDPEVANDFQIPIDVGARGYGIVYEPSAEALEHTAERWCEEYRRKTRIVLRGLTGFYRLRKRIRGFRRWQFISHKWLRWMLWLFLIGAFVSSAALSTSAAFYSALFFLQIIFCILAIAGWNQRRSKTPRKIFYVPFYFFMVNTAALAGVFRFLSGRRQKVWEKAESTRLPLVAPVSKQERDVRAAGAENNAGNLEGVSRRPRSTAVKK